MDKTGHRVSLSVGDERRQLRGPPVELFSDVGKGSLRVGEVDVVHPIPWLVHLHVGVQRTIGLAVREDTLSRRYREQCASAYCCRAWLVTRVAVEQVGLDE